MKKICLAFLLALNPNLAAAASLHPCTPSIVTKPIEIYCKDIRFTYNIKIDTTISPQFCTGTHYFEYKTATVTILDSNPSYPPYTARIAQNSFSYSLSPQVTFTSEEPNLFLNKCRVQK